MPSGVPNVSGSFAADVAAGLGTDDRGVGEPVVQAAAVAVEDHRGDEQAQQDGAHAARAPRIDAALVGRPGPPAGRTGTCPACGRRRAGRRRSRGRTGSGSTIRAAGRRRLAHLRRGRTGRRPGAEATTVDDERGEPRRRSAASEPGPAAGSPRPLAAVGLAGRWHSASVTGGQVRRRRSAARCASWRPAASGPAAAAARPPPARRAACPARRPASLVRFARQLEQIPVQLAPAARRPRRCRR